MGLLNETPQAYYDGSNHGDYQFTSLDDIINQFMVVYVGEDKIISKISRTDVAFHAQRAMQELSFDTFKSCKSQEITVPTSLQMTLPQDYVNYTKISWVDSAGIKHLLYPTSKTSNPTLILQNSDGSYYSNLVSNGDFTNNIDGWTFHNVDNSATDATHLYWSTNSDGVLISSNGIGEDKYPKFQQLITFEDGEDYTFEYNVTSISSNYASGANIKIWLYADGDSSYKPVEIQPTATGSGTATFTWNNPLSGFNKGWLTIELPFGHTNEKSIRIKDLVIAKTKNDGNYSLVGHDDPIIGTINSDDNSTTWDNYKSATPSENNNDDYEDDTYWPMDGGRYGLNPQQAQINGSFYIDCMSGKIHFSSNVSGKTVVLDYISDSLGTDGEMQVHKFAEEAMYKWISHAILSSRANTPERLVNRYKRERFAAIRQAKLRLSNIKLEEITQILRGKSKHIKH